MNTDQKERLLKLAETDPILAHKVADFMNTGNIESDAKVTQQAVSAENAAQDTDAKDLKWTDALLAKSILDNSVSSLGTVVLNKGDSSGVGNDSGADKKLTVTKEQLFWARASVVFTIIAACIVFGILISAFLSTSGKISNGVFFTGLIMFFVCVIMISVASTKSSIPSIKTFLSKNFTIQ